ncbi:hypothetical protein E2C01_078247 [Portunus trituberculatus]|uniref:Uncharacterized protein n=1 Tax=Portunus trituberculatus TaxID=210409 RepID=A0A5B7IMF6_PORTR|nr:hypothetical protein [Portunus trituberculatus]
MAYKVNTNTRNKPQITRFTRMETGLIDKSSMTPVNLDDVTDDSRATDTRIFVLLQHTLTSQPALFIKLDKSQEPRG